jgi:hypothetical protein
MKCSRRDEVRSLLAQGHWPEACEAELREHVEGCRACGEMVMLTQSFRAARERTAVEAKPVPASLVWWRAQLRRRQAAMEQVSKPIWGAQIFAVVVSLCGGLGLLGWLVARGDLRSWTPGGLAMGFSLSSVKASWGLLPLVASVAVLGLLGLLAVYLTVERE